MTDEAHGDAPEEAPAPPTSTRWSEDAVAEDATPAPPFVPGRREAGPTERSHAELGVDADAAAREPRSTAMETEAPPQEIERPPEEAEPFPFDLPAEEAEETPTEPAEDDDFPFEQFDIEGRGEAAGASAPTERHEPMGWTPDDLPGAEPETPAADPIPAPEAAPAAQTEDVGASSEAEDIAALLDRMARLLRTEGEAGVRRELDSPDRLTAVLAGILAGYISGRS